MIGRTLFWYIAWRFFIALVSMMALLFFLIVVVDFIENLRRVKGDIDASTGQVFTMALYTAPFFIDKAFPFAVLFAAMNTLSQLNQKLELVVARAAGISAWQFLLPLTAVSIFVGVFVATVYNPLAIQFYHTSIDMKSEILKVRSPLGSSNSKKDFWLRQKETNGSSVISAELARKQGTLLDQVKIIQFDDDGATKAVIEADTAIHSGDRWILLNATLTDSGQNTTVKARHELPTNISREFLLGSAGNPDLISFWNLQSSAEKISQSGLNHLPYLVQFYSLLALPLLLVAMVLIAATVSLRFVRSGQAGRMILGGIFAGFVLYASTRLVTSLGSNGIVSPNLAAWSPSMVAILFGMSMLLHQEDG